MPILERGNKIMGEELLQAIQNKKRLEKVRFLLDNEPKDTFFKEVLPITHNENQVILQFNGWSIILNEDGTWYWEDTTGG